MADGNSSPETTAKTTAPYTAFQTVKTLCKHMKEHKVPSRIDRSVLTSFSGAVGSQVLTMLKFLGLTDAENRPTQAMKELVDSYDTASWSSMLAQVVRQSYEPLFELDLETATPNEFTEHFRKTYPAADEVSRKSMTFFLNATRESGIKVSGYIMKNKKPRAAPTKRRAAKVNGEGTAPKNPAGNAAIKAAEAEAAAAAAARANATKRPSEQLLDLLDTKEMKQAEQDAIWLLLKFFKAKGQ